VKLFPLYFIPEYFLFFLFSVDLAAYQLDEMTVPQPLPSVTKKKGMARKSLEAHRSNRHHMDEWNGNGYGSKFYSGSSARSGNEAKAGMGNERKWGQNESRYQNGTYENEDKMNHHEDAWYSGSSGMGMSHGPEYAYGHSSMNYYDYYPELSGSNSRPVGGGMGMRPQVNPGMRMGGHGMGMSSSRSSGVGGAHRLGQFQGNHQYQSQIMSASMGGPYPSSHHHIQGQQPYQMFHPAQLPGQYPPNPRMMMMPHRQDDSSDYKMRMNSKHGYMGRPHPTQGQGGGVDLLRDKGDQMMEGKVRDQSKNAKRMVPKLLSARENREVGGGGRKMIVMRGLPGSGKTTLAKWVEFD